VAVISNIISGFSLHELQMAAAFYFLGIVFGIVIVKIFLLD